MVILSTINYQACLSLIPVNAKHWSLLSWEFKKTYEFSLLFYQYVRNLKKIQIFVLDLLQEETSDFAEEPFIIKDPYPSAHIPHQDAYTSTSWSTGPPY